MERVTCNRLEEEGLPPFKEDQGTEDQGTGEDQGREDMGTGSIWMPVNP